MKDWRVNIFIFVGHRVFLTTQFYNHYAKVDVDKMWKHSCVPVNYMWENKQRDGFGPWAVVYGVDWQLKKELSITNIIFWPLY